MRRFFLNQIKQVGWWYFSLILLEFILPFIVLNLNIPAIEELTNSITNHDYRLTCLLKFFLLQLLYELVWRVRDYVKARFSIKLKRDIVHDLTKKTLGFNQKFFVNQISIDISNIIRNISDSTEKLCLLISTVFGYISSLFFIPLKIYQMNNPVAFWTLLCWILVWIGTSILLFKHITPEAVKMSHETNKLFARISEIMDNMDNIFVYKQYALEQKNVDRHISTVQGCDRKLQLSFWKLWVVQGLYFTIFTCLIILAVFKYNSVTIGSFVALYKILEDLVQLMWTSSEHIYEFVENYGKYKNGFNLLSQGGNRQEKHEDVEDYIKFDQVKFDTGKIVCEFDISIKKNTFVALIGQSGSGKSTFIKLLLRILEPTEGRILGAGDNFGYAPQAVSIFKHTLRYNLNYGRPVTDEEISQVLQDLKCDFVDHFRTKSKFDTTIGAHNLSIGEMQKILVGRAILKNAEVMVFDEPTSALDLQSEICVMNAIQKLTKTRIVVSHKISTIQDADQIIIFESGKIVASGTHQSLLDNVYYKSLY